MTRRTVARLGAFGLPSSFLRRSTSFAAAKTSAGVSPSEALSRLGAGNARFINGALTNQNGVTERRLALAAGQAPFASILSCSDSRVPPELVFDAKIGDLFVVRNAGNIVAAPVLGTLEYGYDALGVRLIVVLGHEKCGAVSATYDAIRDKKPLVPNLDVLQRAIEPGIAGVVAAHGSAVQGGALHAAILANAKAQAAKLLDSPVLGPAIRNGACRVVAADYCFAAGRVDFLT